MKPEYQDSVDRDLKRIMSHYRPTTAQFYGIAEKYVGCTKQFVIERFNHLKPVYKKSDWLGELSGKKQLESIDQFLIPIMDRCVSHKEKLQIAAICNTDLMTISKRLPWLRKESGVRVNRTLRTTSRRKITDKPIDMSAMAMAHTALANIAHNLPTAMKLLPAETKELIQMAAAK